MAYMLAVETGVPRLFPLNGILTAATPCETIKNPVSNFGGSLQTDPLPTKPEIAKKERKINFDSFLRAKDCGNVPGVLQAS
jgi:hypothetical protein